jgi:hypothetical protein
LGYHVPEVHFTDFLAFSLGEVEHEMLKEAHPLIAFIA